MDLDYLWGFLSFLIGLAAGYQGVYERYGRDSPGASCVLPGFIYLSSRGAVPALTFILLYGSGAINTYLFLYALACGTGIEVVLRSTFYVKQVQRGGSVEELN
jgi:hypothetical protein